jgi:hypothetical protein
VSEFASPVPVLSISPAATPVEVAAVLAVLARLGEDGADGVGEACGPASRWPSSVGPMALTRRRVWRDPAVSFEGR